MHPIRTILVPIDFSEVSTRVAAFALDVAEQLGASVHVLHAWTTPAYVSPQLAVESTHGGPKETLEALARKEAQEQMTSFLSGLDIPKGVEVKTRTEFGFDAETILRIAADYDMIVMGTHGRSALGRFFMGSVAKKVVRQARCPVIVVR